MLYGTANTFCHTDVLCDVLPTKSEDIAYHCRMIMNAREIKKKKRTWSDNWESGMPPRVKLWKVSENGEMDVCWQLFSEILRSLYTQLIYRFRSFDKLAFVTSGLNMHVLC